MKYTNELERLYSTHVGKVTDKWTSYIQEYDNLFREYKNNKIDLLEIGIQNGGSLEIWSKYFPKARNIIGCDINEKCENLLYEGNEIKVVVGDIAKDNTKKEILDRCSSFEIIIDDGSHISSDIIKTFTKYFNTLKKGGIYVAEDLHCSYWKNYEGGLYHPTSSISFFKRIIDIVNKRNWGIEISERLYLESFSDIIDSDFDYLSLQEIDSISFYDSLCVIKKKKNIGINKNIRIVSGRYAPITPDPSDLNGQEITPEDQNDNYWSTIKTSDDKELQKYRELYLKSQSTNESLIEIIDNITNSRSWKATAPIRKVLAILRSEHHEDNKNAKLLLKILTTLASIKPNSSYLMPDPYEHKVYEKQFVKRNICIFAHFNPNNTVTNGVLHYLKNINENNFEIIFISSSDINIDDIDRLKKFCNYIITKRNVGYDFGSWKVGIDFLNKANINPDHLLLCNDSVYGPIYRLDDIFDQYSSSNLDMYGLTDSYEISYHIQSYFMIFGKRVLNLPAWRDFWANLKAYHKKVDLIRDCEVGLSKLVINNCLTLGAYCDCDKIARSAILKNHPYKYILSNERAYNITHLLWDEMIENHGFPFLKKELLEKNPLKIKNIDLVEKFFLENDFGFNKIEDIK